MRFRHDLLVAHPVLSIVSLATAALAAASSGGGCSSDSTGTTSTGEGGMPSITSVTTSTSSTTASSSTGLVSSSSSSSSTASSSASTGNTGGGTTAGTGGGGAPGVGGAGGSQGIGGAAAGTGGASTTAAGTGGGGVDPCTPDPCTSPPTDTCNGNTLTTYPAVGTCTPNGNQASCSYPSTPVDCGAMNEQCQSGACVDPCVGFLCNTPPGPSCQGNSAVTYAALGTCSSPGGTPTCAYTPLPVDCSPLVCSNGACKSALTIGFCRVQSPDTITDVATTSTTVFGRVFVAGLTDQTTGDDLDPRLVAEVGVGSGVDPTMFTYTAAQPNLNYGPGSPGAEPNNDEYQGTVTVPDQPGSVLAYAYRFSGDAGQTWTYCQTGPAGDQGFGVLDVAAPYFAEYEEGVQGVDKAIEIYNPGSIPFNLTGCTIGVYSNGGTIPSNTVLSGATIAPGKTYSLCKTGIAPTNGPVTCDQYTGAGLWNGNDAIDLKCGGVEIDVFGQIGNDPGANGWGTGGVTSFHHTLLRKCNVFSGDRNGSDAFDPATQWASPTRPTRPTSAAAPARCPDCQSRRTAPASARFHASSRSRLSCCQGWKSGRR